MSSYCVQLTRILTPGGHVFYQEQAFRLLEAPFLVCNANCPRSSGLRSKKVKDIKIVLCFNSDLDVSL